MLRVISEEITAYSRQIDERKNDLPLWERKVLTCDEAAAYSGIGIRTVSYTHLDVYKRQEPVLPLCVRIYPLHRR